jgi:hypothetical protein
MAKFVKALADIATPAAVIDAAVGELNSLPDGEIGGLAINPRRGLASPPRARRAAIAAAIVGALFIGGAAAGVLIGHNHGNQNATSTVAPSTITVPAPPQPLQPVLPTNPDPACAQWSVLSVSNHSKQEAWVKTDPKVPASQWSPEQRALNSDIIPVMKQEAVDLRALAEKAADPMLRALMKLQVLYEEAYAARIPDYNPSDQRLWTAVTDASNMINSLCYAMAPPK